jgi:hypothetical protein
VAPPSRTDAFTVARVPLFICAASAAGAGGLSVKRTVVASSSREKATFCVAGATRQPCGASSTTSAVAAPFEWFTTVTRTSRAARAPPVAGTITISGVAFTANFGTTWSSARFSPL